VVPIDITFVEAKGKKKEEAERDFTVDENLGTGTE
jgi:hypothetical protein